MLYDSNYPPSRERLESNMRDADGVLCMLTDRFDLALLEEAQRLKILSYMSVGLDHVDLEAATRRGIYVTYTPHVLKDATADLTWTLVAVARSICEADRFVRGGLRKVASAPNLLLGSDVYGKTLGIIGMGGTGYAVARRATGFVCRHSTIKDTEFLFKIRQCNHSPPFNRADEWSYQRREATLNETNRLIDRHFKRRDRG